MSETPPRTPASDAPTSPDDEWEALARHLAGEGTVEQAAAVGAWLASHPGDAALAASLDALARPRAASRRHSDVAPLWEPAAPIDTERALRAVKSRIAAATVNPHPSQPRLLVQRTPRPRRGAWVVVGLAAAAAIVLVELPRGSAPSRTAAPHALAAGQALATPVGRLDSARLADGTRVILGPASRVALDADFDGAGATRRGVTLDGEAWFAATHDVARPLEIRAGGARIRDVGTTFTVHTEHARSGATVSVTAGVVALGAESAPRASDVLLHAGDRGAVRDDSAASVQRGVVTAADTAWTQGELVYRDAPLARVRDDLRRWYGVDLQIADSSLANQRLTATFAHEPVDRVLDMIAAALGARVDRVGRTAVLRAAPASAPAAAAASPR